MTFLVQSVGQYLLHNYMSQVKQWEAKTDLNPALVALSPRTYPDAVWMASVGPCLVKGSNSDLLSTKYIKG